MLVSFTTNPDYYYILSARFFSSAYRKTFFPKENMSVSQKTQMKEGKKKNQTGFIKTSYKVRRNFLFSFLGVVMKN